MAWVMLPLSENHSDYMLRSTYIQGEKQSGLDSSTFSFYASQLRFIQENQDAHS